QCLNQSGSATTAPRACPTTSVGVLIAVVTFPGCWDGGTDRSSNRANNVAYMTIGARGIARCPSGFDHPIPRIILSVHYDHPTLPDCTLVTTPLVGVNCYHYSLSENVDGVAVANGSIYGMHSDFLNGW